MKGNTLSTMGWSHVGARMSSYGRAKVMVIGPCCNRFLITMFSVDNAKRENMETGNVDSNQ